MSYSDDDVRRLKSYAKVHLRKNSELSVSERIPLLEKKKRSKFYQILLNVLIILFFGYSYYYEITTLGDIFFYILAIVFTINVIMLHLQRKQIDELMQYYRSESGEAAAEQ
ncbi:MAG: hypothetical protein ACFCU6_14125 [Balneolaceae bacterium]